MSENQIEIIGNREVELLEKQRKVNLQKLFTPEGMDAIIVTIKKEIADFKADVSTKEGRAKIVSMAAKVAKCKSPIEKLAKEAKDESQKIIAGIQTEWKRYESEMDALRDKIRKPVDDIKEKEEAERENKENRLAAMENLRLAVSGVIIASSEFEKLIKEVKNYLHFDWGDYAFKAETLANDLIAHFEQREAVAKKSEADAAELAQLKKEKAEREQKDREEQIACEAAAKAEENHRREVAEYERQVAETKRLAEEGAKRAEQQAADALNRAKEAEENRIKAEQKAKDDAEAAKKKAAEDAEKAAADAIEKERLRVAEEKRKEDEATEKREKNKRHKIKIEKEAAAAISKILNQPEIEEGGFELIEKKIIEAIAKGEVPNVQINY